MAVERNRMPTPSLDRGNEEAERLRPQKKQIP